MSAERFIYALTPWTVEKRPDGWYMAPSAVRHRKDEWQGPYRSEATAAAAISRLLKREIMERYERQRAGRAA
jgi:hypothetical protein